jgi:hypothetical protein
MYPTVYTDDSKTLIDFSRNKDNVTVPNHSKAFTDKDKMKAYVENYENTVGIVSVCEDEIEVTEEDISNSEGLNTIDENLNTISRDLLSLFSRTPPINSVEDVFNNNAIWVVVVTEFTRKNKDMKFEFSHNNIFGLYKNSDDAKNVANIVCDEIKERAWGFKEGLRHIEVNTIPFIMPPSVKRKDNKTDSDTNNSRLIPYFKDHLFAVIELSEYKEQTNGSVTAIFVSEENARKYADELLGRLNEEKHRTVVKSYRVLVQPIPKEDIEKPGGNTPDPVSWCLPPKK